MLHSLSLREDQRGSDLRELVTDEHADMLERGSRTLITSSSVPIASIGILDYLSQTVGEDDVGIVWAAVSDEALRHPVAFARGTREWLDFGAKEFGYRWILAQMAKQHDYLHRWAKFLGFEKLDELEKGCVDGSDAVIYVRDVR